MSGKDQTERVFAFNSMYVLRYNVYVHVHVCSFLKHTQGQIKDLLLPVCLDI